MAERMSELRTDRPPSSNGGATTRSNPSPLAQRPNRLRRPPSVVAEGRVGCHEQAGEPCPRRDPVDELVILGRAQSRVEMLDDDDLDAGLAEHPEPFGWVEEEWRRGADENLVRVGIKRDDGRPGTATPGLLDEPAEQIAMTEVNPVEHADDGEQRAVLVAQALDPGDDLDRPLSHPLPESPGARRPGPCPVPAGRLARWRWQRGDRPHPGRESGHLARPEAAPRG